MELTVFAALQTLGEKDAKVELVTERHMIEKGLFTDRSPGLLIDGYLAWARSVPTSEQVVKWIQTTISPTIS
jgi:hypothetical protein